MALRTLSGPFVPPAPHPPAGALADEEHAARECGDDGAAGGGAGGLDAPRGGRPAGALQPAGGRVPRLVHQAPPRGGQLQRRSHGGGRAERNLAAPPAVHFACAPGAREAGGGGGGAGEGRAGAAGAHSLPTEAPAGRRAPGNPSSPGTLTRTPNYSDTPTNM
eukprot:2952486-Pyramimonas_sp.AAC.1